MIAGIIVIFVPVTSKHLDGKHADQQHEQKAYLDDRRNVHGKTEQM